MGGTGGLGLALSAALLLALPASAATISVNTTADQFGTGRACTLREAVQTANTDRAFGGCARKGSGPDLILLRSGKRYLRSISAADDTNAGGDLDISGPVTIRPRDRAGRATIDAEGISRVLEVLGSSRVTISRVILRGGRPLPGESPGGGAVRIESGGRLSLSRADIHRNRAAGMGGGLENQGNIVAKRVRVARNSSTVSGGGLANIGTATLDRVVVSRNRTIGFLGSGGGISNEGRMAMTRSTIFANEADMGGGIILPPAINAPSLTTIRETTISGNSALLSPWGGGGVAMIAANSSKARLINVTVSGNASVGDGGGVLSGAERGEIPGQLQLISSTVVFNSADSDADGQGSGGGIMGDSRRPATFTNTIVGGNRNPAPGILAPDCSGVVSTGYNLISDTSGCGNGATDIIGRPPALGPLAANGGPTLTHMPKRGSPVINLGSRRPGISIFKDDVCASRDQRGVKRPQGPRCDIGAVERRPRGKP